ncbi:MAG: efflux RND transporter periplasmic adaptor subunit [Candidatus Theseobacter exili]|nr:efflux RND transporter periplasmic adaptor subunit [Candidatus Theseobacter exili]
MRAEIKRYLLYLLLLMLFPMSFGCEWAEEEHGIVAHGRVELDEIHISTKMAAQILSIDVKEGDRVSEAQLLGTLDLYNKKNKDLERARKLFEKNDISDEKYEEAQISLRDQSIISPINGIVLLKAKFEGETVVPGQTIVSVGNLMDVYAKVYVPEKLIGKLKLGAAGKVSVDSFPGENFSGNIIYISDSAEFTPKNVQTTEERTRRMYAVKISLDNKDQKFKPGMACDVIFNQD